MIIGNINIPNAILLAPMEDVTDISFRLVCKQLGADIVYTEFVNSEGLIRNSEKTKRKMAFLEEENKVLPKEKREHNVKISVLVTNFG